MAVRIINADVLDGLGQLASDSVDCVVTSPPYWGLRDYGVDGQIGLEPTLEEFLAKLTAVFREVRRVLKPSGTCFVNMGDAYCNTDKWGGGGNVGKQTIAPDGSVPSWEATRKKKPKMKGLKPKDLMMQPALLALALQADGWWLRSEIIWAKSNPMPDSAPDRPASTHEKIFLLTKSARYFWDAIASREKSSGPYEHRLPHDTMRTCGDSIDNSVSNAPKRTKIPGGWDTGAGGHGTINRQGRTSAQYTEKVRGLTPRHVGRNMRNVWTFATHPCAEAHFATFPPELPRRCIIAGCPEGGTVLDIFGGSGTTGFVAEELGRDAILIELNPDTVKIASKRIAAERLKRKRATMADIVDAGVELTPLEAWLQNAEPRAD